MSHGPHQCDGLTLEQAQAAARAVHETEQRHLLNIRLRDWQVGEREKVALLRGVRRTPAMRALDAFADKAEKIVCVLAGPSDVGKSVASVHWLLRASQIPMTSEVLGRTWQWSTRSLFLSALDLPRLVVSFDRFDRELFARAQTCPALVLDDVGSERKADGAAVTDLVVKRHRALLPTVLSTNLDRPKFAAAYPDGRVLTRVARDGCWFTILDQNDARRGGSR